MKIPRDISADDLIKKLKVLKYVITRQSSSHIRVTTHLDGEYHETIPWKNPLKVGTLNSIGLSD